MFELISSKDNVCEFAVSHDDRIIILNMFEDNMIDKENIRFPTFDSPEYLYITCYNLHQFSFKYNRLNRYKSYIERKISDIPKGYHILLSRTPYQKMPKIEAFWSYPWVPNYIQIEPRPLQHDTLGKFIKIPLLNGKTTIDIINQTYMDDSDNDSDVELIDNLETDSIIDDTYEVCDDICENHSEYEDPCTQEEDIFTFPSD